MKPKLTLALGTTAARSVFDRAVTVASVRGEFIELAGGGHATATIHPSYLLRLEDDADKRTQCKAFVADLKLCAKFIEDHAA